MLLDERVLLPLDLLDFVPLDLLLLERGLLDELLEPDEDPLRPVLADFVRAVPDVDFLAVDVRPDAGFLAVEDPLPDDRVCDDALRLGDEPLLDFAVDFDDLVDDPPEDFCAEPLDFFWEVCDDDPEDFACGADPLDPFDDPLPSCPPASRLTPPTTLVATPIPRSPTFFQSVRRRPTGRPSTVERRLSLRGLFMVASLAMCGGRAGKAVGCVSRSPWTNQKNWAIRPSSDPRRLRNR